MKSLGIFFCIVSSLLVNVASVFAADAKDEQFKEALELMCSGIQK